jgi:rRNA maturation RNase YbeY
MAAIQYFTEDIDFDLPETPSLSKWIKKVAKLEGKTVGEVSYIFCSDDYLHRLNVEYLNHDTLTDIITFPYNDNPIEGDIFISIDRLRENAKDLNLPFAHELHRVMIHGVLHLCGYRDESDEEEMLMREKEDMALGYLAF